MQPFLNIPLINQYSLQLLSIFLVTFIKGLLVFIVVCFPLSMLKNISHEVKHLLWLCVTCSFILIPIFSVTMPLIHFEMLGVTDEKNEIYRAFSFLLSYQYNFLNTSHPLNLPTPLSSHIPAQIHYFELHWSFWVLITWILGVIAVSFKITVGRIALSFLKKNGYIYEIKKYYKSLTKLSSNIGIYKKIALLKSSKCLIPFTYKIFKPTIVLPADSDSWAQVKVRSVLIHELAHIRRKDHLLNNIARLICTIFWFIPPIWIAYSYLHNEQEKACDSFVIRCGVKKADYATHILDFAGYKQKDLLLAGLFLSKGRIKTLEERILNVLSIKKDKSSLRGGKKMKTKNYILGLILILAVFASIGSCATGAKSYKRDFRKDIVGTWVNSDYNQNDMITAKVVVKPDNTMELYHSESTTWPSPCTIIIENRWTDSEGNIYYKAEVTHSIRTVYELWKLNNSKTTWELMWRALDYFTEIDPNNTYYRIYYRQ